MLCPKCGFRCADDAAFCMNCGQYVKPTETAESQTVIEALFDMSSEPELQSKTEPKAEPEIDTQDPTVKVYSVTVPKAPKTKKITTVVLIITLCLVLCTAAGFGIFAFLNAQDNDAQTDSETSSHVSQNEDVSSDASSDVTSVAPEDAPSKITSKYLVGDWGFDMPASSMISLADGVPESFNTTAQLPMVLRFTEDKTVHVLYKAEDYKSTYLAMAHDYAEYLKNGGIYEVYELNGGYTREQVDNMMEEYSTTPELIAQNIEEDLKSQIENGELWQEKSMTEDGYIYLTDPQKQTEYELDGDTLTFVTDKDVTRETYFAFEYSNNTLTVTEGDYAEGILIGKVLIKTY